MPFDVQELVRCGEFVIIAIGFYMLGEAALRFKIGSFLSELKDILVEAIEEA